MVCMLQIMIMLALLCIIYFSLKDFPGSLNTTLEVLTETSESKSYVLILNLNLILVFMVFAF